MTSMGTNMGTSMGNSLVFKGIENFGTAQNASATKVQFSSDIFNSLNNWGVDEFTPSQPQSSPVNTTQEPPKIGMLRVIFNRLTQEQIDAVNETKQLPKNAKFSGDVPSLTWNLIDFTKGTHKLPAGYELKRGILGFTHVVREGSKAWYLKK